MVRTRKLVVPLSVVFTLCGLVPLVLAAPFQNPGEWVFPPFNHGMDSNNPLWDPDQGSGVQDGKPGSNCKYNAIHACLIASGPNQGKVLVFGDQPQPSAPPPPPWTQFWSILTVGAEGTVVSQTTTYANYSMSLPDDKDMFCSGHAWMADGRLFVAGGTYKKGSPALGSDRCFIYDPTTNAWTAVSPLMARPRWYPTVTLSSDDAMMVFSGVHDSDGDCVTPPDTSIDTYEVWDPSLASGAGAWQINPSGGTVFAGPGSVSLLDYFRYYPRMHVLTNGRIFMSGMHIVPARLRHDKVVTMGGGYSIVSQWEVLTNNLMVGRRLYGSSFLFPGLEDVVMTSVGADYEEACRLSDPHTGPILSSVQYSVATATPMPSFWSAAPSIPDENVGSTTYVGARTQANTVILPDESILLVGGMNVDSFGTPVALRDSRLFTGQPDTGSWALVDLEDSDRGYHATALLLPDGRVLSAGGNDRDFDYQVYRPPYLLSGYPRPAILTSPATMQYFDANPIQYSITYNALPPGVFIQKIVLVAPGADTHHSDMAQRLVRMTLTVTDLGGTRTKFYAPRDSKHAPRGYYMLFAVTNQGTPSVARWVKLS